MKLATSSARSVRKELSASTRRWAPSSAHRLCWILAVVLGWIVPVDAAVTRMEIRSRQPYADGRRFGEVGAYEVLRGKAYFAVDPLAPANARVVDLELAPRNPQGLVEFEADVEILAPVERARGRGTLLYDVNNRGNKVALGQFNGGADEFLLRNGFTVVWSGWIAETQPGGGRLRLTAPVALENGKPLVGVVRAEVVVDAFTERASLAQWANQGCYEPTEAGLQHAVLTWRQRESDSRAVIPRGQWRLEKKRIEADGEHGQLPQIDLMVSGGMQPGYIYELVYEASGSLVQGVGLAGMRDLVSFLKYDASEQNPLTFADAAGPRRSSATHAIGFGVSQSGRCLRLFLHDGFNADEAGRRVFDGVIPHVAGAGVGFFNHRFASPTRHNTQHDNHLFPADMFPFAYGEHEDPFSGRTSSILAAAKASNTLPKVMHTQSSSEYWHRSGSLVHTDPQGEQDSSLPDEVRVYCFGGTQHGPGSGLPAAAPTNGQLIANPADYRPLMRALLLAMDKWVRGADEPPPSVYPHLADGTLVGWRESESGWQALPGVRYPEVIQQPEWLARGSEFFTNRRITIEPPVRRGSYVVRVPAIGKDNNERGTLQLPCVAVPVATYTSWNLRSRAIGAENELLSLNGGYIPLPKTEAERKATGDPRPSLESLYRNFDDYRAQFERHARALIEAKYLLEEELPALRQLAEKRRGLFP